MYKKSKRLLLKYFIIFNSPFTMTIIMVFGLWSTSMSSLLLYPQKITSNNISWLPKRLGSTKIIRGHYLFRIIYQKIGLVTLIKCVWELLLPLLANIDRNVMDFSPTVLIYYNISNCFH